MTPAFAPTSADRLRALVTERLAFAAPAGGSGVVRVAVDGAPCTRPDEFAASLIDPLRAVGRPVELVRADTFWRDASLRMEHGREDVDAVPAWLDEASLRREVLDPVVVSGRFLPSLRDPVSNRATREVVRDAAPGTVLIVSGALLLGRGLPFEVTVHLAMSAPARARHTPPDLAWTLAAFDRYDAEVAPTENADVVVRLDDPRRPAVRV